MLQQNQRFEFIQPANVTEDVVWALLSDVRDLKIDIRAYSARRVISPEQAGHLLSLLERVSKDAMACRSVEKHKSTKASFVEIQTAVRRLTGLQ